MTMMTKSATQSGARTSALMPVVFVALLGAAIVFMAGFAKSQTLHDAAHDMRHATGFPCH